jgi:hypothetical protein
VSDFAGTYSAAPSVLAALLLAASEAFSWGMKKV